MTSKEFLSKVLPYKKILPKELHKGLLTYFLDYDTNPNDMSKFKETQEIKPEPQMTKEIKGIGIGLINIDSGMITIKHVELISKWIDNRDVLKVPYEFKLLFRGSRDGFTHRKFHEFCDNQPHTVTIIKVKDSDEILGGYNPITWKKAKTFFEIYGDTKESFIFSFKDKENIENHILSRTKDNKYAIEYCALYGPSFGRGDLRVGLDNNIPYGRCIKYSYEKTIRNIVTTFYIEEYEVFQLEYESFCLNKHF
jgi:hypothetical protein